VCDRPPPISQSLFDQIQRNRNRLLGGLKFHSLDFMNDVRHPKRDTKITTFAKIGPIATGNARGRSASASRKPGMHAMANWLSRIGVRRSYGYSGGDIINRDKIACTIVQDL
jgi:hypothetical protein